ncbi:hypothetical protein ACUNV4_28780 [Granulosicoccus sp. 3-233]
MKLAENLTAYHTAKAGIVGLTRGLASDAARMVTGQCIIVDGGVV